MKKHKRYFVWGMSISLFVLLLGAAMVGILGGRTKPEDIWEKEFYHCANVYKERIEAKYDFNEYKLLEHDQNVMNSQKAVRMDTWQKYIDFVEAWVACEGNRQDREAVYKDATLLMILIDLIGHYYEGIMLEEGEFVYAKESKADMISEAMQTISLENLLDECMTDMENRFESHSYYRQGCYIKENAWTEEFNHCLELLKGKLAEQSESKKGLEILKLWETFIAQWADNNEAYEYIDCGSGLSYFIAESRAKSYRTATLLMISYYEQHYGTYEFIYDMEADWEMVIREGCPYDTKLFRTEERLRAAKESKIFKTGETSELLIRWDDTEVYFTREENDIPEELVQYFVTALQEGKLEERAEAIKADYRIMQPEEKAVFEPSEKEDALGLSSYYEEIKNDTWYCVSLTEEGDDIVVEHEGTDGCVVNYLFWNVGSWHTYMELPLRAGGQAKSHPYFVTWENKNYLVTPYWDGQGERLTGAVIYEAYNCYDGAVKAIGMKDDGTIEITPQIYDYTGLYATVPDGGTLWPVVDSDLEKEARIFQSGETIDVIDWYSMTNSHFVQAENEIPKELVQYFVSALEEGRVLEKAEEIRADYAILGTQEKKFYEMQWKEYHANKENASLKDDTWYCLSLTEEGNDFVVEHRGADGCVVNYLFLNTEQADHYVNASLYAGGQANSYPRFVTWEDKNYMVIPYWDGQGEQIIGATIYKFYDSANGEVTAIGRNSDGTIQITPQRYEASNAVYVVGGNPLQMAVWPVVVSDRCPEITSDLEAHDASEFLYRNMSFLNVDYNPDNSVSEELEKLLGEKLLDGTLIDFLTANSSDSTVLTEEEIGECVQQDTANVLWSFRQEEGKPEDEWIRFGRDGDIIVRQRLNDEKCIYYKFPKQNASSSYEWGLYAFGSGEEHYFLDWESEDYLVTVKRNAQKELIGIATYCMFADWIYGWQLYQEIDGEEIFRQYTTYVQNGNKYVGSAEPEYY